MRNIIFLILIAGTMLFSCTGKKSDSIITPENNLPGKAEASVNGTDLSLENNVIRADWSLKNGSLLMDNVLNKYDGKTLSNADFRLNGLLQVVDIFPSDSLPTASLHLPGKKLTGTFISEDGNLSVTWSAILRDSTNYIRQVLQVRTEDKPVKIRKVTMWDGKLPGAKIDGYVLGSPVVYRNFFFGYEHPTAQSKALFRSDLGYWYGYGDRAADSAEFKIDLTSKLDGPGKYILIVQPEYGTNARINMTSATIFQGNMEISRDDHPFNFEGGDTFYHLEIPADASGENYNLVLKIINGRDMNLHFVLVKTEDDILNFFVRREDELDPGHSISASSVTGVVRSGQMRRDFLSYLENERAKPYRQFLHYNSWYDICGPENFLSSENTASTIKAWGEKFIEPYNIDFQSFVFDDGWDNLNHIWYIDPVRFPDKFEKQAALCCEYHSGLGLWMSPYGGYGDSKQARLKTARKEGFKINDKGLSLSGPKYYTRFRDRALTMMKDYRVNYFKFDGFGGSDPKYLPDMEAGVRLMKELRKQDPDLFINATVGTWPSPFWLMHVDATWRQEADMAAAGKGSKTQQWITYRDGSEYNNIVRQAPLYPLNSLMLDGIVYAKLDFAKIFVNKGDDDFKDQTRSFFATGTDLQELYVSQDIMDSVQWNVLAEAAHWAKKNEDVLKDVHWIGGSPFNMEVYGFAAWNNGRGTIALRNPDEVPHTYSLEIGKALELPGGSPGNFLMKSPWKEDAGKPGLSISTATPVSISLKPFEVIVWDVNPE